MKETTRLLLVDDDRALCQMLNEYLTPEGFAVRAAHDGEAAIEALRNSPADLVILDVMLPGLSGLDVLREFRASSQTPVLMLTARGDEVDRIVGLELGADDYLAKPFNPRELVARIRAILRRAGPAVREPGSRLEVADFVLDPATYRAAYRGQNLTLTGAEFRVLQLLLTNAGTVVTREALTEQALGRALTPYDRAIDTHVSNLRRKIGRDDGGDTPIRNVRGAGYLLRVPGST
jgi:two-component system response regulator CpxR